MLDVEFRLTKEGSRIKGRTLDLGEWDISEGFNATLYINNPNPHAKAIFQNLKNEDARVKIECAKEIYPLSTIPIKIRIDPHVYQGEQEEKEFFTDLIDALTGKVKWVRP